MKTYSSKDRDCKKQSIFLILRYIGLAVFSLSAGPILAKDYFDPAFLGESGLSVDLSQFENDGLIPEGDYIADVFINNEFYSSNIVSFTKLENGKVIPILTLAELKNMGVNIKAIPSLKDRPESEPIGDISEFIDMAKIDFDVSQLRLNISVPQAHMIMGIGTYVDPNLWDQGINALLLNYTLNTSKSWAKQQDNFPKSQSESAFGSIYGGINMGAWRLRSSMLYTYMSNEFNGQKEKKQNTSWNNTYVQRDIQRLKSELVLGETNIGDQIFDPFTFKGILLRSNTAMLPANQRGYAPIISGFANSNAKVTITQNGMIVYQTSVSPGPFNISDINSSNTSGDLTITVQESDGTKYVTTQSYSALPIMQREGGIEYSTAFGRYKNGGYTNGSLTPFFSTGTLIYGLTRNMTLYGGLLGANNYKSAAIGLSTSLGRFGAFSVDVTHANSTLKNNQNVNGSSLRARYSKSMLNTGTTFNLTTYRYATDNFYTFTDVNTNAYELNSEWAPWTQERRRSSWQTTISQTLSSWGSLHFTGRRDDYWGSERVINTLNLGLSSNIKKVGYSLNYTMSHISKGNENWPTNHQVSLGVSVPLSLFSNAEAAQQVNLSYNVSRSNTSGTTNQLNLNGPINNNSAWNTSLLHDTEGRGVGANLGLDYNTGYGSAGLNYGYDTNNQSLSANLSGGIIGHRNGITFSEMIGDSVAIINAPGATNVPINTSGNKTNRWGYAVATNLQTYQRNSVSLDPAYLPNGVDIENNSINVYPTKGAVVEAKFKTKMGYQAIFTLKNNNKYIPFGAITTLITDDDDLNSGIVGDNGMLYLSGLPAAGQLKVKWGAKSDQQCQVNFSFSQDDLLNTKDVINIIQKNFNCI